MQARSPLSHGRKPLAIVLAGVSGSGKTTVGKRLAAALNATFLEGDAYHSPANIGKMRAGVALEDRDRWPWLAKLGGAIAAHTRDGRGVVVACSALKRCYRDALSGHARTRLTFVQLAVDPAHLEHRLRARHQHFMPASLLASQLATLEPLGSDEVGTAIVATGAAPQTVAAIQRWLKYGHGHGHRAPGTLRLQALATDPIP